MRWWAVIGMAAVTTTAAAQQKPLAPLQPQATARQPLAARGQPLGSALATRDEAADTEEQATTRRSPTKAPARALGASLLPGETDVARQSALDPQTGNLTDEAAPAPAPRAIRKPAPAPRATRRR